MRCPPRTDALGAPVPPGENYRANLGSAFNGRVLVTNGTLADCIKFAYGLVSDDQLAGPEWIKSKEFRYDIDGRAPAGATRDQMLLMLRTLLETIGGPFRCIIHPCGSGLNAAPAGLARDNLDILPGILEQSMSNPSQKRAIKNYRKRLTESGMARFEVLGLDADRELIRALAKRLADNSRDSGRIRAAVRRTISGERPNKGGVLSALRRSPLVGAELNLKRAVPADRKVDL